NNKQARIRTHTHRHTCTHADTFTCTHTHIHTNKRTNLLIWCCQTSMPASQNSVHKHLSIQKYRQTKHTQTQTRRRNTERAQTEHKHKQMKTQTVFAVRVEIVKRVAKRVLNNGLVDVFRVVHEHCTQPHQNAVGRNKSMHTIQYRTNGYTHTRSRTHNTT